MTTNNSIIGTPVFATKTANPSDLKIHDILVEMGFDNKPDSSFTEILKMFNCYEKPVIDMDNNVITHAAEVLAAVENGIAELDVYQVDLTSIQLRLFISLKHKFHTKNLIATFKMVQFYENYLTNTNEGKEFAKMLPGTTTREKIASIMHTSDSTVKRIKLVGENKPESLGLIENGQASFKEVCIEIKLDRMAANIAKRNKTTAPTVQPEAEYYIEPVNNDGDPLNRKINTGGSNDGLPTSKPTDYFDEVVTPGAKNEPIVFATPSVSKQFELLEGSFTVKGLGNLTISVSENVPTVTIDGKVVPNMSYTPVLNRDSANGVAQSFILSQPGKKGMSIQLTVENFSQAA